MADKKDDVILNKEDQKLSKEKKQDFETNWNSDVNSEVMKQGVKLPDLRTAAEIKPVTEIKLPVTGTKQAGPSTAQDKLTLNGKLDKKDTDAGDKTEAKGKTETTDKANRMRDSLKAKTDTTATDKSINQFQIGEKSDFDEQNKVKLEGLKQREQELYDINDYVDYAVGNINKAKKQQEKTKKALEIAERVGSKKEAEAAELVNDLDRLAEGGIWTKISNVLDPKSHEADKERAAKLAEIYGNDEIKEAIANAKNTEQLLSIVKDLQNRIKAKNNEITNQLQGKYNKQAEDIQALEADYNNAVSKQQQVQAKYDKDKKDYKTWEAEYWAGAEKDEKEAEKEAEKDKTEDPLEKAEELEQKKYQTPADIKKFSNDLNRFVIQAYLKGDFGKRSNPNAIATMGFFILDKIGAALVNASEVARGMSPSAKSQWSNILDKQTELLGKRITANWFLSLSREEQEALIRSGVISGTTGETIYGTVDPNAVSRAEQRDILGISKLSQEQKGVAQSNLNALLARKSELQTLITQLKSDQGWEAYAQAMNAVVGTAKGLSSLGVTDDSSSSSNKGFSDQLSAKVSTGNVTAAFVSGGISNNSTWNNSSAKALSKSNSLSQDALALSKFKSGEDYAKATREAKKAANEQLIKRLEGQIEIIDKCIDSWGKDLGL